MLIWYYYVTALAKSAHIAELDDLFKSCPTPYADYPWRIKFSIFVTVEPMVET